jgi:hypothetical protein
MEKVFQEIITFAAKEGPLGVGLLVGAAITHLAHYLAAHERKERHRLDLEREKELYVQLQTRDQRIDKLHAELGKRISKR